MPRMNSSRDAAAIGGNAMVGFVVAVVVVDVVVLDRYLCARYRAFW